MSLFKVSTELQPNISADVFQAVGVDFGEGQVSKMFGSNVYT